MKNVIIGANSYLARNFIYKLKHVYNEDCILYGRSDVQIDNESNYTRVNMLDRNEVSRLDLDCDNVFMFVGKTGSANGFDNYEEYINVNQKALLNLLDQMRKQNSHAKLIFLSTRLVYSGKDEPQKEDACKEFKTVYSINKFACEQYIKQFNNVFGIDYLILRLCIPYGTLIDGANSYGTCDFMLKRASNNECINIYGDGSQRRTLTYIGDFCDILYQASQNKQCKNDVYNIGGENYSLYEMASVIAKKYGVNINKIEFPDIEYKIESGGTVFNSDKLDDLIGDLHKTKFVDWINEVNAISKKV